MDDESGTTEGPATTSEESTDGGETDGGSSGEPPEPLEPVELTVIEEVTFYDGYAGTVDHPVPEGIIRHSNALYGTKLSDEELDSIQSALSMRVYIGAL